MRKTLQISKADFKRALTDIEAIVGKEWLFVSEDKLVSYKDTYAPGTADNHLPGAAVAPRTVEEVRKLVRVANKYRLPLWSVSAGKNFVYGSAAPVMSGTVVLDLTRMKGIQVDEEMACVIVEPGVTYTDLYRHLKASGSKLWMDSATNGMGSVIGNALDNGVGYTVYGDHASAQCGMEVVLANGDLVRTGMGAMRDNPAWAHYQHSFGPSLDGLFFQSNLGIVTRMGIWLMPEPEVYTSVNVHFEQEEDIVAATDILRKLRLDGTVRNTAVGGNWLRNAIARTSRAQWYDGKGAVPDDIIRNIQKKFDLGWWSYTFALYGHEATVAAQTEIARSAFAAVKGMRFLAKSYRRGEPIVGPDSFQAGIPSMAAWQVLNWPGGTGSHVEFAPVVPLDGKRIYAHYLKYKKLYTEFGFDYFCSLLNTTPRAVANTNSIFFNRDDEEMMARARQLFVASMESSTQDRYGGYRTHIDYMDAVASKYDFNDGAAMRTYERLKDALDPNGILSPGKSGIWPKNYRGATR